MQIQKIGNQNYNKKQNFGAIHVVGNDKTSTTIMNVIKSKANKNYQFTCSNPFFYGPERGLRQYYVSCVDETELAIIKALKQEGRTPRNVLNSNNQVLSKDAFDKFIQETHIMDL